MSEVLQTQYGFLPTLDLTIETHQWDGYRLNPQRIAVVDVAAPVAGR